MRCSLKTCVILILVMAITGCGLQDADSITKPSLSIDLPKHLQSADLSATIAIYDENGENILSQTMTISEENGESVVTSEPLTLTKNENYLFLITFWWDDVAVAVIYDTFNTSGKNDQALSWAEDDIITEADDIATSLDLSGTIINLPDLDVDDDGYSNYEELRAGSDPLDNESLPDDGGGADGDGDSDSDADDDTDGPAINLSIHPSDDSGTDIAYTSATVYGEVTVYAIATDDSGVSSLTLISSEIDFANTVYGSNSFTARWDTTQVTDHSEYTFTLAAVDDLGNTNSETYTLSVGNEPIMAATASPGALGSGESETQLSWTVSNATQLQISNAQGDVLYESSAAGEIASGRWTATQYATETYTLTATHSTNQGDYSSQTQLEVTTSDYDGDGVTVEAGDCLDTDNGVSPLASEDRTNFIDDDCDDVLDIALGSAPLIFDGGDGDQAAPVAIIRDANGDGFDDLLIGAPYYGYSDAGQVYLNYGASNLAGTLSLETSDVTILGANISDKAGTSVGYAGDVDGDGLGDMLIAAPYYDSGSTDSGLVCLIRGETNLDATFGLAEATLCFGGEAANNLLGKANNVAGAGDINGDGLDDFLIGSDTYDSSRGIAYRIWGDTDFSGDLGVTSLSGATYDYTYLGENTGENTAFSLSSMGDFDNDGYDDIVITAIDADYAGLSNRGTAYIIWGSSGGSQAGSSQIEYAGMDAAFVGQDASDRLGYSADGAGDFNGDGYDDLLLGAPYAENTGSSNTGKAYVIFGHDNGVGHNGIEEAGGADVIFVGENDEDYAGYSVAGIGDTNGDGYDDILIAAPYYDGDAADSGKVYLIYGGANYSGEYSLSQADQNFYGEASDQAGIELSYSGSGDLNGDGFADIVIGTNSHDEGDYSDSGRVYVIWGQTTF